MFFKCLLWTLGVLVVLLAVYVATQVARSPVEVTPERFYVTEPRLENGDVDYYAALMENYAEIYAHPDQNGFLKLEKALKDAQIESGMDFPVPDADGYSDWAAQHDPLLDTLAQAVREPYFLKEFQRPKEGELLTIVVVEDVALFRALGQMMENRIRRAAEAGDVDRAIDDVLTLYRLSRHVRAWPSFVHGLVGCALERMGEDALKPLLLSGQATDDQLARLESELDSLPERTPMSQTVKTERYLTYDALQGTFALEEWGLTRRSARRLQKFFDENITRKHFGEVVTIMDEIASDPDHLRRRERHAQLEKEISAEFERRYRKQRWRWLLLYDRSRIHSFMLIELLLPAEQQVSFAFQRDDTRTRLARLALRLERFRQANGRYPAALAELPGFSESDTFDPYTGNNTITYRNANPLTAEEWSAKFPEMDPPVWTPYLLYSFGGNRQDDGGNFIDEFEDNHDELY